MQNIQSSFWKECIQVGLTFEEISYIVLILHFTQAARHRLQACKFAKK